MSARNSSFIACCFLLAPLGSGCAAIAGQAVYLDDADNFDGGPFGTLYLGTRLDFLLAVGGEICCIGGPSPLVHAMGIADLPFSMAVDTALLPIAIWETVARAVRSRSSPDERDLETILD